MPDQERQRDVSPERRIVFYVGSGIAVVGILLFLSVFVTGAMKASGQTPFGPRQPDSESLRGVIGFILMFVGSILANVGRRGLAGSGITLNPRQARRDLEPHNRAIGGMIADAVDEFRGEQEASEPTVKIRCRDCSALNDETAKFCDQCGRPL